MEEYTKPFLEDEPSTKRIKLSDVVDFLSFHTYRDTFPKVEGEVDLLQKTAEGYQMTVQLNPLLHQSDNFSRVTFTVILKPEAKYGFEISLKTVRIQFPFQA